MNEDFVKNVEELIKDELLKRGINVDVTVTKDSEGEYSFKTTGFQTYPVLYKELYCQGTISCVSEISIAIRGEVRYTTFYEGYNATHLFSLKRYFDEENRLLFNAI